MSLYLSQNKSKAHIIPENTSFIYFHCIFSPETRSVIDVEDNSQKQSINSSQDTVILTPNESFYEAAEKYDSCGSFTLELKKLSVSII